jgi:hypothetical protein
VFTSRTNHYRIVQDKGCFIAARLVFPLHLQERNEH